MDKLYFEVSGRFSFWISFSGYENLRLFSYASNCLWVMVLMPANGPAVSVSKRRWVDQRASAGFRVFVTIFISPSGAKRGAIFAIMVQFWLRAGVIAVQICWRPVLTHGAGFESKPPGAVSRYKLPAGAINNSRYRIFGAGRCAYPGAPNTINSLESRNKTQKLWQVY